VTEQLPTIVVGQLPSDAVFTSLGRRIPVKPPGARSELRSAAIDAVVSDSLLLIHFARVVSEPMDESARAANLPSENDAPEHELTLDLTGNTSLV
jgi:hypothetical protein